MEKNDIIEANEQNIDDVSIQTPELNLEAKKLLNKIIAEKDTKKAKDLTTLFNENQVKKTLIRTSKIGDILDLATEQLAKRMTTRPDEISNQELLQSIKVAQDIVERGQKQVSDAKNATPLIQVNQQNNEINLSTDKQLTKASRDKVREAVLSMLTSLNVTQNNDDIIDVTSEDTVND